jgi:hypothetical protein
MPLMQLIQRIKPTWFWIRGICLIRGIREAVGC